MKHVIGKVTCGMLRDTREQHPAQHPARKAPRFQHVLPIAGYCAIFSPPFTGALARACVCVRTRKGAENIPQHLEHPASPFKTGISVAGYTAGCSDFHSAHPADAERAADELLSGPNRDHSSQDGALWMRGTLVSRRYARIVDLYMELPYILKMADQDASAEKFSRAKGRPCRADAPIVPWNEVDRLLVFGEKVKDESTGRESVSFPSYTELAARYGVSKSRIGQYATRAKCLRRREETQQREQARYEQKVVERRAEARALGTDDVVRIIDGYIEGFSKAVDEGKVRFDSPGDLDRLVRLKELMLGNADSRQEIQGGLTLDAIQQRHQRLRRQIDGLTPELAGIDTGEAGGSHDRAVH